MNDYNAIWVLTQALETEAIYSGINENVLDDLAAKFLDEVMDENDEDAPKTVDDIKRIIRREAIYGSTHSVDFGTYNLRLVELNVSENGYRIANDEQFKVVPGARIFEAAERVVMGCDMSYALSPYGYFTRKVDNPDFDKLEWIELELI